MPRDEFDPEQYTCLEEIGRFPSGKGTIDVGIWRYADNAPKVKVKRVGERKGEAYHRDVGSMSAEDCEKLAPLLAKAGAAMRKLEKKSEKKG